MVNVQSLPLSLIGVTSAAKIYLKFFISGNLLPFASNITACGHKPIIHKSLSLANLLITAKVNILKIFRVFSCISLVLSLRAREHVQSIIVINVHFKHRFKTFILTCATPQKISKKFSYNLQTCQTTMDMSYLN